MQFCPRAQVLPQVPQFLESVWRFVQVLVAEQYVSPVWQQAPLEQLIPLPQPWPHWPQLYGSTLKLTHCIWPDPLGQAVWPVAQVWHFPLEQVPLQYIWQAPQLLLSLLRSTHLPKQSL